MSTLLIASSFLLLGLYLISRFLRNVQPSDAEIAEDTKILSQQLEKFRGGFVDWTDDISSNTLNQILSKSNSKQYDGVFLSNNNEPVFAYAVKKYIAPGRNELIYILSQDNEYIFRITNKGTEININGERAGIIRENGYYYDSRNREIAQLKKNKAKGFNTILIEDKAVATIALPDKISVSALTLEYEDMETAQKDIIRTYAIYDMVQNISLKKG